MAARKNEVDEEQVKFMENKFDDIMEHIGWFGLFTNRLYVVMYIIIIYGAMNIAGSVFIAADVPYICEVDPSVESTVVKTCNITWTNAQTILLRPIEDNEVSKCERYTTASLLNTSCSFWLNNETSTANLTNVTCSSWVYDQSIFHSTVISDFGLVCKNEWKQKFSQFLLMFGILIGAMFCGIGSDRWGRRTCFLVSLVVLVVFSISSSFVKVFWLFAVFRMMVGVGSIGLCISGVVYAMEITSVRHRVLVSQTLQASFSFAFMFLALFGYLERRWIYLNLIISVPLVAMLPFYVLFSGESPRWLLSNNKPGEALATLQRMASVNKKRLDDLWVDLRKQTRPILKNKEGGDGDVDVIIPKTKLSTLELFRNPTLRMISLVLFYNWFAVTCIYYGLTLNTATLDGDKFLNFFLVALVEIPANFGVVSVIKWWGRRPTICTCNVICGISLISMMFVPKDLPAVNIFLFLVGKFGATATFSCIYLYSAELYPTPLRGNGLGVCSGWARLGGVVSQLVIMLGYINQKLPFVVFGFISGLAGVLIVLLPETKGLALPQTISDTERIHKHREISLVKQFVPTALRNRS